MMGRYRVRGRGMVLSYPAHPSTLQGRGERLIEMWQDFSFMFATCDENAWGKHD